MNLNIKDLLNKVNTNEDISIFADREIIKELMLGLDVEECPFVISGIKPEDDLLMLYRIDDTYIIESPFCKRTGELMLIEVPHMVIEDETLSVINHKREMGQIIADKLEVFSFTE